MTEMLQFITKLTLLVFIVASMITVGLSQRVSNIIGPLLQPRLVLLALAANFVAAPLLALLLTKIIPLQQPYAIGLLLLGAAAGAPFLPKLTEMARGDIALSVAMMILLMIVSVAFLPLALPFLVQGLRVNPWSIAKPLVFLMLLPMTIGFALKNWFERSALWLYPIFHKVTDVTFAASVVLVVGLNMKAMAGTLGSGAIGACAVLTLLSVVVGYALGGPDPGKRRVLGLATGARNVAAALAVGQISFEDPGVVVMVVIGGAVGLILLLPTVRLFSRKALKNQQAATSPAGAGPR